MARIRTVKPEFWGDEKLAPMCALDRLVFLGLISMADDAGRVVDNVKTIDGFIFPETDESSRESLTILAETGRIVRYKSASGQRLIQIANWKRHQRVDNPAKYVLPGPDEEGSRTEREPNENELNISPSDLRPTTNDPLSTTNDPGPTSSDPRSERESARETIEAVAKTTFGDDFATIEEFLATRKASSRTHWLKEMLRLVSPGSQYVVADVVGACRDATIEGLQQGAHGFRAFVEKHRQLRMRALEGDGPPSRGRASQPGGVISASDAFVDKIMAMARQVPGPTGGIKDYIPKHEVAQLGARVVQAYDAIGGADRFFAVKKDPEKMVWLRKEFAEAFGRAVNAQPAGASP